MHWFTAPWAADSRVDHLVYHLAWPRPAAMCSRAAFRHACSDWRVPSHSKICHGRSCHDYAIVVGNHGVKLTARGARQMRAPCNRNRCWCSRRRMALCSVVLVLRLWLFALVACRVDAAQTFGVSLKGQGILLRPRSDRLHAAVRRE